ncbi:MAG: peptide chain release factor N(5)-glutamine methyltransferase [Acidimicrobiia bacterium]|nr:peptide chain release factor N(5)-glutamine methyltransferase [Acidimicrobiia bacterium]MDH5420620.1 peptide chain release factor N(5)-glutamine methyltransferase [Acidimicrobiia bacterium]MDH5503822.1 peptide chain release factor N(5)-glutamine methyltransferase [Acidimicrobiia bacterium]
MTTRDIMAAGRLPRNESERLLMKVTGRSRAEVIAGVPMDDELAVAYSTLCRRRLAGEPLQYIEGSIPFALCEIAVDRRVLIPRPETEYLWELACTLPDESPSLIVDLCTGSGALAVGLAAVYPEADVVATDISEDALNLAADNAKANGQSVRMFLGDLFEALPTELAGQIDLLVANPPYVSTLEMEELPEEVAGWEPHLALAAGSDGLSVLRVLLAGLGDWLRPGGWFFIEVGSGHAAAALDLLPDTVSGQIRRDLTGRDRYLVGQRL